MSVISKNGTSANTLSKCSNCQDRHKIWLFLTKQGVTIGSGASPKYQLFKTRTFVETNLTATSKGNTVSMVTVSSCTGNEKGGKKRGGKKSYSVSDLAIDVKGY